MTSLSRNLQSLLRNSLFAIVAVIGASIMLTTTASAKGNPVYYTAQLEAPAKDSTNIVKSTVWHCDGATCKASKARSKDAIVCARMVRKLGKVASFTADGTDFDADALAICNDKA